MGCVFSLPEDRRDAAQRSVKRVPLHPSSMAKKKKPVSRLQKVAHDCNLVVVVVTL